MLIPLSVLETESNNFLTMTSLTLTSPLSCNICLIHISVVLDYNSTVFLQEYVRACVRLHRSGCSLAEFLPFFSPLWLYSSILGLGCLHETFRFISVTKSRTISRTPWMGDQLVARSLLTAPGNCEDGGVGGINGFW
jgi:hypothetical protein